MSEENTKKATLYGKTICGYCAMAKQLLTKSGYDVEYINLDDDNERKLFYDRITNEVGHQVMSVPQIWIFNKYIGNYTDLVLYLDQEKDVVFDKDF